MAHYEHWGTLLCQFWHYDVALSVWAVTGARVAHCEDVALSVWAVTGARVAHCEDVALQVWAVMVPE